jgi:hypothetical protein
LVKKTKELRRDADCACTGLQLLPARQQRLAAEASSIGRALNEEGYYYLLRESF